MARKQPKERPRTINEDLLPAVPSSVHLAKWDDGTGKKCYLCWVTRNATHHEEISLKVYNALIDSGRLREA